MNKLAEYLRRLAGIKSFVAALLIFVLFSGFIMPQGTKTVADLAGKPVEILDLQFSYNTARAAEILSAYTPQAIEYGARFSRVADTAFPLSYGFLLIVILAWIYNRVPQHLTTYRYLHLLPIATVLIDYIENFFIRKVMLSYPGLEENVVAASSFFTSLKWLSVAAIAAVAVFGLLLLVRKKIG